jgi:hypothetical protein
MELSELFGDMSHHAYGVVSPVTVKLDLLAILEKKFGIVARANPDVFAQSYESLSIDDARGIKDIHATRPFAENGRKFFIIEADSVTHEAQNALLKMFEEPNDYARFFLVIPSEESLLPTLRSRLLIVRHHAAAGPALLGAADFLALKLSDRVAFMDKLSAEISDGKKPKTTALDFCAHLSRFLRRNGIEKNAKSLAVLSESENYLRDRAPSVKQLLEYVALGI